MIAPVAPVAELVAVSHRYGRVAALTDVSLSLQPGQITALLGPNGAGKTTAVSLLTGLTRPSAGEARLFGGAPTSMTGRRRMGVMLQVSKVPETLTVREHVHLFSAYYPSPLPLPDVLALAGLASVADRRFGKLSGGQKQRVLFALAICGNPDLLFLDEPTVGMDVESRRHFWRTVRELAASGRAILLTTHYLEEAEALCGRIAMLKAGRVVALDTTHNLLAQFAGLTVRLVAPRVPIAWQPRILRQDSGVFQIRLDAYAELETLLGALRQEEIAIAELGLAETDLEQVFLRIMKNPDVARVEAR